MDVAGFLRAGRRKQREMGEGKEEMEEGERKEGRLI